jgi:acyl-CoA synthetase (AMP-forming)/AMP-acid ligase II
LEFLVLILALTRARLIAAPFNPGYMTDELRYSLQACQARAIIVDGDNRLARDAAAAAKLPIWDQPWIHREQSHWPGCTASRMGATLSLIQAMSLY